MLNLKKVSLMNSTWATTIYFGRKYRMKKNKEINQTQFW